MRTRRSPRNQETLFSALFPRPPAPKPTAMREVRMCGNCASWFGGTRRIGGCVTSGNDTRRTWDCPSFQRGRAGREGAIMSEDKTCQVCEGGCNHDRPR